MMKIFLVIVVLISPLICLSQNLYKTESGKVKFLSDAFIEDIEAKTSKTTAVLNSSVGDVAVLIPIKSFAFDKSLMKEHFNENYMESDKFPLASFKGKIAGEIILKPGEDIWVTVSGDLMIHGVSQQREIKVNLNVKDDKVIIATGKLDVRLADHKVKIPTLVFQNIAEVVEVTFELMLKKS